jgi:pyruvate dehydrogenase E1 component beta subunit
MPASEVTYREAIGRALSDSMAADRRVVLLGEDVGKAGGVFKVTAGLYEKFGPEQVLDTPISETGFLGAAVGMALVGFRPIVELMFADFAGVAFDQIVNQAAKYRYLSAGQMGVSLVVRGVGGAGLGFASQHSQTTESWFLSVPGLKVVVPATPQDAYSLLRTAVDDPDPVIYLEHKALYVTKGPLDVNLPPLPIGVADVVRSGTDCTIVASLAMVREALTAGAHLANDGIEIEVINVRTLAPLDIDTIVRSVERTSRLLVVEEEVGSGGWAGNVVARVCSQAIEFFDGAPAILGTAEAPIPFSQPLERLAVPSAATIADKVRQMVGH